ncbi:hypothetical protein [Streptomyces sp. NPDC001530]|uniref:hypothetical protein n=1 Tax=Streptomyces sp. NPDC001530 TaxID=3364582 RepID=UPI0036C98536
MKDATSGNGTEETRRREAMKGRAGAPDTTEAAPAPTKAMVGEGTAARAETPDRPGTGTAPEQGIELPAPATPAPATPTPATPAHESPSGEQERARPGATAASGEGTAVHQAERHHPVAAPREGAGTGRGDESPSTPRADGDSTAARDVGVRGRAAARLLREDECEKFSLRLRHAVGGFVDGPRDAVEEADHVLEELAARFTEAVAHRRRTLRTSWQPGDEATPSTPSTRSTPSTEDLRLALRDYRDMTERLLRL